MDNLMHDIVNGWVDQQAEQARLVNAVAKAAAEHERDRCCRQICIECWTGNVPDRVYTGGWFHSNGKECTVHMIRERGYQEDNAPMNT